MNLDKYSKRENVNMVPFQNDVHFVDLNSKSNSMFQNFHSIRLIDGPRCIGVFTYPAHHCYVICFASNYNSRSGVFTDRWFQIFTQDYDSESLVCSLTDGFKFLHNMLNFC